MRLSMISWIINAEVWVSCWIRMLRHINNTKFDISLTLTNISHHPTLWRNRFFSFFLSFSALYQSLPMTGVPDEVQSSDQFKVLRIGLILARRLFVFSIACLSEPQVGHFYPYQSFKLNLNILYFAPLIFNP